MKLLGLIAGFCAVVAVLAACVLMAYAGVLTLPIGARVSPTR